MTNPMRRTNVKGEKRLAFAARLAAVAIALAGAAGCQQKMAVQPYYRPYETSSFFPNGMSARPFPDGVIAREWLTSEDPLITGLKPGVKAAPAPAGEKLNAAIPKDSPNTPNKFVDEFPFELTRADLDRGQQRYTIFCAICHDPLGTSHGKLPERGYVHPPSYIKDFSHGFALYRQEIPLREVPVGYMFEVVSRGFGAMPRYGPQIPPKDRWRIIAYVRALQISGNADVKSLPASVQRVVQEKLGGGQ